MEGIIFDIQYYALYDGPGIRTTVFFKGCPLRCAWCHNPESMQKKPEMAYSPDRCRSCAACVDGCPEQALSFEGRRVVRDGAKCILCGLCAEHCPNRAMEIIGRKMTLDEVVEKVLRDRAFYAAGGGVTFSGGEPTDQMAFLLEAAGRLKAEGIQTALETCGLFGTESIGSLAEVMDLFLFDLKLIDAQAHKQWTGASNDRILANFKTLVEIAGSDRILARLPLIPGVNDDKAAIARVIDFLRESSFAGTVHLMPYNRLARSKWEKIGRIGDYRDFGELTEEMMDRIEKQIHSAGFDVVLNE